MRSFSADIICQDHLGLLVQVITLCQSLRNCQYCSGPDHGILRRILNVEIDHMHRSVETNGAASEFLADEGEATFFAGQDNVIGVLTVLEALGSGLDASVAVQ